MQHQEPQPHAYTLVINTCAPYAPVTLPPLLASLDMAGFPRSRIVVTCGQCPGGVAPEVPEARGVRVVACDYAAEALTGLIALSERPEDIAGLAPWVLYIQDTMMVGERFPQATHEVMRQLEAAPSSSAHPTLCVKLCDVFSLSVGFYSVAWLRDQDLAEFKASADVDEHGMRQIKTWCEDKVFERCPPESTKFLGKWSDREMVGTFRYSDEGHERYIEHYPVLDLYKFKSWDGDAQRVGFYRDPDGLERVKIPVGV